MIDEEIYVRTDYPIAIFAYRHITESIRSLTHYACVINNSFYIKGYDGSTGRISHGRTREATEAEVECFMNKLHSNGFHYNKANKRVIQISTGELL